MASVSSDEATLASSFSVLTNWQLAILTLARMSINIAYRIIYPLQPFLIKQLQVTPQTVSSLVAIQLVASLFSPLGGSLSDLRGERFTMTLGLSFFIAGSLACAISGSFSGFLLGYALIGMGISFYQPAATSYLSARSSYAERGRILGIFETSWAAAAIIGVAPLMLLVQATQSSVPVYIILIAGGIVSLFFIRTTITDTSAEKHDRNQSKRSIDWAALRTIRVITIILVMSLVMFAYDLFGVSQGVWLQQSFKANESMLGQIFLAAGIAELCGSIGVTFLVDRIGKKRAAFGSFLITAISMFILPFAHSWELVLVMIGFFFLAEEFAIVSALPLISEAAPTARGTSVALTMTISSLARALGAVVSPALFLATGISGNLWVAAGLTLAAAIVGFLFVHEGEIQ